ncbi:type II toxin-antitoxin system VapC family toxin [[Phormidium] sp. ETS-05]|uniref:type II toxin-antitoxin system VapC family toxin n=1 Tax=[Phormidium] sp. ETS-05 TaxID=222819 RepID=UPI001E5E8679|nr:type II toxin-antitoxin system VapC family toxin [[Phormidium] sp. ETS-05]
MSKFVVDASVAIKWVVPEIHSAAALRLRKPDYELIVPDFFFPEIGNILWKRVRRGESTQESAQEDLTALMELTLNMQPSLSLMPQALEIAVRIEQAVYDCVYLALAVSNDCQMVTADQRFYNALRGIL